MIIFRRSSETSLGCIEFVLKVFGDKKVFNTLNAIIQEVYSFYTDYIVVSSLMMYMCVPHTCIYEGEDEYVTYFILSYDPLTFYSGKVSTN